MGVAGAALTLGAVLFLAGAANPRLFEVWTAGEAVQLRLIHARPRSWQVTNLLFAIATVLTAAGLTLTPDTIGPGGAPLARLAAAMYGIAAVMWLASITFRLFVTPAAAAAFARSGTFEEAYAVTSRWSGGLFAAFTLTAGSSLVVLGVAVVAGGAVTALAGWLSIAIGAVIVGGYLVARDMPPFVAYLPTGVLGIAILLART
jgi:hypothetical protein